MEEYVPLPGWWYVGTLKLNGHRFLRSINRSTVCPHQGPGDSRSYLFLFRSFRIVEHHRGLFVCGFGLTSGQLINELLPDCIRSCFSQVVLCRRDGDRIYEMRCLYVAVGPNALFIVLPHWANMS